MANMDCMVSVVVPAFNEESRLATTLPVLWKEIGAYYSRFEIVVVDDGSTDRTANIVVSFAREHEGVRLVRYQQNRGKGYAVRTGILASVGEHILFCDADLSTPMGEIVKLKKAIEEGCDVAIGSRATRETRILQRQPWYRIVMGKTFNKMVQLLAVPGIWDTQCGFKMFTRSAAWRIFPSCRIDGFGFDVEALFLARKQKLKIVEIGVQWRNSPHSKVHPIVDSLRMMRDLLAIRGFYLAGAYRPFSSSRTSMEAVSSE